jgi:hypothetical protein
MMEDEEILDNQHQSIEEEQMFLNVELNSIQEAFLVVDDHHLNNERTNK